MGSIAMTGSESWKEREDLVARYRVLEQEVTDPLAKGLLRDIVVELEAELHEQRLVTCDRTLDAGIIEFHGGTVPCLVRNISEFGAALDVITPRDIPDRFTLALPFEGISHRCSLIWRSDMEIGVSFHETMANGLCSSLMS
jgi:hypothetical protein